MGLSKRSVIKFLGLGLGVNIGNFKTSHRPILEAEKSFKIKELGEKNEKFNQPQRRRAMSRVPRALVIADSLSYGIDGWVEQARERFHALGYHLQCDSQPGRAIRTYTPSADYFGRVGDTIIYAQGGNDVFISTANPELGVDITKSHLYSHLDQLQSFPTLLVIMPDFGFDVHNATNWDHINMMRQARLDFDHVEKCDLNSKWDPSETSDGLHPNSTLAGIMADHIYNNFVNKIHNT